MKRITLKDPSSSYDVTILKSSRETKGKYTLLEVHLYPGGGNDLHYHTTFSEHFAVVAGELCVQIGKNVKRLRANESFAVARRVSHRFYNESTEPVVFRCTITPARSFEKALRIGHGLAMDGLLTKKGLPKKFWHGVVLFDLSESYLAALPLWFQVFMIGMLSCIARWLKVDHELERYCRDEQSSGGVAHTLT